VTDGCPDSGATRAQSQAKRHCCMACRRSGVRIPLAPPCLGSRHRRYLSRVLGDRRPGPSARASLFVAPVGAGWVDVAGGQDFSGSQFDDGDAGHVGDREDFLAAVGGADAQMVHAAGPADAYLAACINVVVAQPVVAVRGAGGPGLGQGPVAWPGVERCTARFGRCSLWCSRKAPGWRCRSGRVAAVAGGISWQTLCATDGVRTRLAAADRRSPAPTIRRVPLCTFVNSFSTVASTGSTLFALVTFTRAEYYYSRCHEIAEQ
jgi:hypothetical protein